MHTDIRIDMNSWIIQDGNYEDFSVGETHDFALEFCGRDIKLSNKRKADFEHIKGSAYRICGQVCFAQSNVWVIDVGFKAFWEHSPPEFISVGDWIEGEVLLGIDPYFYKEYLHKAAGMPSLISSWSISKIERDDTPWLVTSNPRGGKLLTRAPQQERWVDISRTNAWEDDDGRASYILHIARIG